jgi:hypothetical protein
VIVSAEATTTSSAARSRWPLPVANAAYIRHARARSGRIWALVQPDAAHTLLKVRQLTVRTIFATALVCSVASLIVVVGFASVSGVPSPGAEAWRWSMVIMAAAFLVGWLGLALWARHRIRLSAGAAAAPSWLGPSIVIAGALFVLVVLLFVVG